MIESLNERLSCRSRLRFLTFGAVLALCLTQQGCDSNKATRLPKYVELWSQQDPKVVFGSYSFSKDSSEFAAFGTDGQVRVYDTRTGDVQREWASGQTGAEGALWSPTGEMIATVTDDDLRVWDAQSRALVSESKHGVEYVQFCCWSMDGTRLFVVNNVDFSIEVYDPQSMENLESLTGHTDFLQEIVVSRDGRFVASAGYDGSVRVWSAADYHPVATLREHPDRVLGVAFSPDSKRLAGVGLVGRGPANIVVWDTGAFDVVSRMRDRYDVERVWFSADGSTLYTTDRYTMHIWDVADGSLLQKVDRSTYPLDMAVFSQDEEYGITFEDPPQSRLVMWERAPNAMETR